MGNYSTELAKYGDVDICIEEVLGKHYKSKEYKVVSSEGFGGGEIIKIKADTNKDILCEVDLETGIIDFSLI